MRRTRVATFHDHACCRTASSHRRRGARPLPLCRLAARPGAPAGCMRRTAPMCRSPHGEFELLTVFATHPERVLSRDFLLENTRGREAGPFDRTVDVQVGAASQEDRGRPARPAHPEIGAWRRLHPRGPGDPGMSVGSDVYGARCSTPTPTACCSSAPTAESCRPNPAALELFGYARDQLIGMSVDALVPHRMAPSHAAHRNTYSHSPKARPHGQPTWTCGPGAPTEARCWSRLRSGPLAVNGAGFVMASIRGIGTLPPGAACAAGACHYSEHVVQGRAAGRGTRVTRKNCCATCPRWWPRPCAPDAVAVCPARRHWRSTTSPGQQLRAGRA